MGKATGTGPDLCGSKDAEEILAESLHLLGVESVPDDKYLSYGPLRLSVASKVFQGLIINVTHPFSPLAKAGKVILLPTSCVSRPS